jgi:transposase
MEQLYYVGLDIHKKIIAFCIKLADGSIVMEGKIEATKLSLQQWAQTVPGPWIGAMEATIFTSWVYETLEPYAAELQVGNPLMMKAISSAKKKNDLLDARTIADLLRCNLLPRSYMPPAPIRELRRVLRFRNMMMRQAVRMKNKSSTLLMDIGMQYSKKKLHGKKYFSELLEGLKDVHPSIRELLEMSRGGYELFESCQRRLVKALAEHPNLKTRVEALMSIRGVGEITALTWALEIGEPDRFRAINKAVSYCGLCSALDESAGKSKRCPISKQRNKHLQTILIESAKLAPFWNRQLAKVYDREREHGSNHNQATIAVARKLVAYLLAVDKSGKAFIMEQA